MTFGHPDRVRTKNLVLWTVRQFDLLHAGCQCSHMVKLKSNPPNEIVKVALGKAQFDAFLVIWCYFEAVDYFKHKKEGRRWRIGLFVFLLC